MVYGYLDTSLKSFGNTQIDIDARQEELQKFESDIDMWICKNDPERKHLKKLCKSLDAGDLLIISSLDSLGHTPDEVISMMHAILARRAILRIADIQILSPYDSHILGLIESIFKFANDSAIQRRKEGKERARREGRRVDGRPRKFSEETLEQAYYEWQYRNLTIGEAAAKYGMSTSTLSRFAKKWRWDSDYKLVEKYKNKRF